MGEEGYIHESHDVHYLREMDNLDELKQWFSDNPFPVGRSKFQSWEMPENVARTLEKAIGKSVSDHPDKPEILRLLKAWAEGQTR